MQLTGLDWIVVGLYFAITLVVGLYFTRRAGTGTEEYFLAGRAMPWWLIGTSMVATTFSTDTPNLVTDLVRTGGVAQNWLWWAFLLTGMLTVFFYAKLWRRSGVLTDIGFYELRYSGRIAAFLRGFRAIYLGVFFNVMIMATVNLAAIKIGGVLLGVDAYTVILVAGTFTVLYSATSGLWGVLATDLLLFVVAMIGSILAAVYALRVPEVGGLGGLVSDPAVQEHLSFLPDFSRWEVALTVFIIPIAVQWWATWYPGSEPGGGGYAAQRMLAARSEKDSLLATLWFNIAHYSLRPWPWILVALASLIVYPTLDSIQAAFPHLDPSIVRHDLAYPAMLVFLPAGILGLVVASLAAAYMSTISTHLNWGASYIVDDVYRRFMAPDRDEKHYVTVGRLSTIGLIILASIVSIWLENAMQAFQILLQIGAGTGLVFILRWFWWRINGYSELAAMIVSFLVAVWFTLIHRQIGLPALDGSITLVIGVAITTIGWLLVTLATRPTDRATLESFYRRIRPFPHGWKPVITSMGSDDYVETSGGSAAAATAGWFFGCTAVYGALFGTGYLLYGRFGLGLLCLVVAAGAAIGVFRVLPKVGLRG